jgi:hypothetical protein
VIRQEFIPYYQKLYQVCNDAFESFESVMAVCQDHLSFHELSWDCGVLTTLSLQEMWLITLLVMSEISRSVFCFVDHVNRMCDCVVRVMAVR